MVTKQSAKDLRAPTGKPPARGAGKVSRKAQSAATRARRIELAGSECARSGYAGGSLQEAGEISGSTPAQDWYNQGLRTGERVS